VLVTSLGISFMCDVIYKRVHNNLRFTLDEKRRLTDSNVKCMRIKAEIMNLQRHFKKSLLRVCKTKCILFSSWWLKRPFVDVNCQWLIMKDLIFKPLKFSSFFLSSSFFMLTEL